MDRSQPAGIQTVQPLLAVAADPYEHPFLTTGRQSLETFLPWADRAVLVRVVDPPGFAVPERWTLLTTRGPYAYPEERRLMAAAGTDVLLTKDSGGTHTAAKPSYLVLDLCEVSLLAAAVLTIIVTAQREDQSIHGDLRVVGVPSNRAVARVLRITGIDTSLRIHPTVADALDAIDKITQN